VKEPLVATATVEVSLAPETAFAIFTGEIDRWWRPGPINWNNRFRAVGIRIEPRVGGRWLELHANPPAEFDCGLITAWEPPDRFVFLYRDIGRDIDGTEVEVRFEVAGEKTRVTIEHRGWEGVAPGIGDGKRELKATGWGHILRWYEEWAEWGSALRLQDATWLEVTRAAREKRAATLGDV
jgi:hypothetical protein